MADIAAIPGQIVFQSFSTTGGQVQFSDPGAVLQSSNTLFGISGFHNINEGFINWQGTLTP